jgi:hypothetical protein
VNIIRAQLSDGTLAYLVINGETKTDYWIFKDQMTYGIPLVLYKGDILEISGNATANILVEII